jgi:hypothetical protein
MPSPLDLLTTINLDDLIAAFGWENFPAGTAALRVLFRGTAEKFAHQMLDFDARVGADELTAAARATIRRYVSSVRIFGRDHLPAAGPLLILANHPGMADTLALFSAIQRDDLRIIALDRPFLQALPNTTRHLFFISAEPAKRINAVKQTATHLRNGGAVLTFPAGQIEPDANVYAGARESLNAWTDSAGTFIRFAPQTKIVPAFVRGVLWDKAVTHPLTRLKKDRKEREKLGAAFQLLAHIMLDLNPVQITVQFAPPITVEEAGSTDVSVIHAKVIERMQTLVQHPPEGIGENVL